MPHNLNQKYDEQKYTSYFCSYQLENRIQKKATDACKTTTELEKTQSALITLVWIICLFVFEFNKFVQVMYN